MYRIHILNTRWIRCYCFVPGRDGRAQLVSGRVSSQAAPVRCCCQRVRGPAAAAKTIQTIKLGQTAGDVIYNIRESLQYLLYGVQLSVQHNMTHERSRGTFRGGSCVFVPNFTPRHTSSRITLYRKRHPYHLLIPS